MKFNAEDILKQSFGTQFRGYDPTQVHEFLDGLAREWDHMQDDLKRVTKESETAKHEVKEYRRRERSLHDALDMAKTISEDIRHQAERDAELIVAAAELQAEKLLAEGSKQLSKNQQDIYRLREQRIRFEAELQALLGAHQKMLSEFADSDMADEVFDGQIIDTDHAPTQPPTQPGMSAQ